MSAREDPMKKRKLTGALSSALAVLALSVGSANAQSLERTDVAILNDHLHVHKVFVVDAKGEQHTLGFVGHDQFKTFDVPAKIKSMGNYRIALQQYLPLSGIGVSVEAPPMKVTPVLMANATETVTIILGNDTSLSTVETATSTSRLTAARLP
jgi:hypothetical protein